MRRVIIFMLVGAFCPLLLFAQSEHFVENASVRNQQLGHYYRMVTWEDSHYREFAWYQTNENGTIKDFMNWRVAFPPGFNKADAKKYPMIVMLHGAGESGRAWSGRYQYLSTDPEFDNNGHQLLFGAVEHYIAMNRAPSNPRHFPGIVIFPQVNANGAWVGDNLTKATKIVEHMIEEYNVDPFRIFIHGLSNGGKGVWEFTTLRPDLFSAGLPMSGVGVDLEAMTDSLVTMPLWVFQGELDKNPSPGWSKQWIKMLQEKGGKPRYTLYQDTGHGTWKQAYAEPDFFSWILQHDKRNIYYFADTTHAPAPEEPLKLGFSAGFSGYQWTRNGQDIPGANGRFYTATQPGRYSVRFKQKIGEGEWAESFELDLEGPAACGINSAPTLAASGETMLPLPKHATLNQSLNLEAKAGYEKYHWYKDGEFLSTSTSRTLNLNNNSGTKFQPADAGIYTVLVEDSKGCLSSFAKPVEVQWFDSSSDVLAFTPVLHATGSTELPLPDSVKDKSLSLLAPAGFTSYQWYRGSQLLAGQTLPTLVLNDYAGKLFTHENIGTYRVKVANELGKTSLMSNAVAVSLEDLAGYTPPLVASSTTDLPMADSTDNYTLRLEAPEGFTYYQWYKNGKLLRESESHLLQLNNSAGTAFQPADTGHYSVVVAKVAAYPSDMSNSIPVTWDPLPFYSPELKALGSADLPLPSTETDRSLQLEAPAGYSWYMWYRDGALIAEGKDPQLVLNDEAGTLFDKDQAGSYQVVVKNAKKRVSLLSNPVNVSYSDYRTPVDILVSEASYNRVVLNWSDKDTEAGYEVWRARKHTFDNSEVRIKGYPAEPLRLVASLPANATSFTDSLLRPGADYEYQVKAIPPGEGLFSESQPYLLSTLPDDQTPGAPEELKIDSISDSAVLLSWMACHDNDVIFAYEIFMGDEKIAEVLNDDTDADLDPTNGNPGPPTQYLLTGLEPRQEYLLKVRAVDYQGNDFLGNYSEFSNTVSARVILGVGDQPVARAVAYPNPFTDRLFIELPFAAPDQPMVLYDQSGRLIREMGLAGREATFPVDLPDLADGFYILNIGEFSFRLIKKN